LLKLTEPIQHDVDLCGCLRLLNRFEHQEAFTIGSNIEEQCCSARQEWPAVGLCYINVSQRLSRPTQLPNLRDGGERSRCEGNDPLIAPTCAAGHHTTALAVGNSERSTCDCSQANTFAKPKSRIFATPSGVTLMLAGLISRCVMFFRCASSSPSAIWRQIVSAFSNGSGQFLPAFRPAPIP